MRNDLARSVQGITHSAKNLFEGLLFSDGVCLVAYGAHENTSGKQWVMAMLGSLYERNGLIDKALDLFLQSKEEAKKRKDELGVLNSLHTLVDLFLYWDVAEYANLYASEAIQVEKNRVMENPMVSAQTYIDKGRALLQLGETDSIPYYTEKARKLCQSLPYNSGMVDVNLLNGIFLTERGGDSLQAGIQEFEKQESS